MDDDADVAAALEEVLQELGHVVWTARDGASALRLADALCPEVVIVDIGLPVMDGYELSRHLRESSASPRDLRVIALSGYARNRQREAAASSSFDFHLTKPPSLDVLADLVEHRAH
ncbi:MAG TPA: response regulator [Polyangia bacterium]|nr:response regulator [Polyangia bacterium]